MKLAALSLALALSCIAAAATADPIQPGAIEVVDGDTITVRGQSRQVRLLGFDTPETGFEARCEAERTLAAKATQRLRQIVASGGLDLTIVPCPCWRRHGTFGCNLRPVLRCAEGEEPRRFRADDQRRLGSPGPVRKSLPASAVRGASFRPERGRRSGAHRGGLPGGRRGGVRRMRPMAFSMPPFCHGRVRIAEK